ncbi:MAG TPA: glycerophosphodiester phosphodiesterase family protein [Propionibacteriaceae bacterium]|nr:glycerophosphodiester phosphodiesterase family protein [Propionibacteriaceae bacterium]
MTTVWAHRGASAKAPENTLAAFRLAHELGADGVELDVQLTADGRVVVIHDETLDRTTTGRGPLASRTLDELRTLDASYGREEFRGECIPLLEEVLELLGPTGMTVNIELKNSVEPYPGLEEAVVALVAEAGLADKVIYSTFNHISATAMARSFQPSRVGLLFSDILAEPWSYAERRDVSALHPHWRYVELVPETVERCHAAGLAVNVWTVDSPVTARRLADLGVDAVISNRPDEVRRVL